MAALETESLPDLLDAENELPSAAREEILRHAAAGAAAARGMIRSDSEDALGHLMLALHLGFEGIAKGKVRAFFEGIPNRVISSYRTAIRLDETVRAAGPLQVKGRFRSITPFPYRDQPEAIAALERARSLAPVKQTLLFLGDAYARSGRLTDAKKVWTEALRADPASHAAPLAPLVDVMIERRLEQLK